MVHCGYGTGALWDLFNWRWSRRGDGPYPTGIHAISRLGICVAVYALARMGACYLLPAQIDTPRLNCVSSFPASIMLCSFRFGLRVCDEIPGETNLYDNKGSAGIRLGMGSANERRRYIVKSSSIGWAHRNNNPYWVSRPGASHWSLNNMAVIL